MKRKDLLAALEVVKPGLATKEMVEQSTSFCFLDDRLVTYNDEISISTKIENCSIGGKAAVRAEELYKLLSRIKKEDIELTITEKELLLSAGRSKAGISLQQEIKLPLEELEGEKSWKKLPEDFLPSISFVIPSCAKEMSRPILMCINVQRDFIEASDNYKVTRKKVGPVPFTCLLPLGASKELINYPVRKIAETEGWLHFKTVDGTIFSCRTYLDTYPDFSPFLKVKGKTIEFPRYILDTLDRAAVFVEDKKDESDVEIKVKEGKLVVRSQSEAGWFQETCKIEYKGDVFSFTINPIFLQEVCKKMRSCVIDERCLKFTGEDWEHVVRLKGD